MQTATSTSEFRFGKDWAEHAAVRALVWYVSIGGQRDNRCIVPMYAWEAITGKDFSWCGANYHVDSEVRKQILRWTYTKVEAKFAHKIHAHSTWAWLDFFSPKQQQRIVEILYLRYPI